MKVVQLITAVCGVMGFGGGLLLGVPGAQDAWLRLLIRSALALFMVGTLVELLFSRADGTYLKADAGREEDAWPVGRGR